MKPFSEEALEAINNMNKAGYLCPDCGKPANLLTGYCKKHSWHKSNKDCPHCGYKENRYFGGLIPIAECSRCKKLFNPL